MDIIFFSIENTKELINGLIIDAQDGNVEAREKIISDHLLFIKKIVSKKISCYEDIGSRDEYSIGLMAFNEAIDRYKPGFRSFQSFAASVIKKRLIDFYRSQSRHLTRNTYLEDANLILVGPEGSNPAEQIPVKMEIESFMQSLSKYNLTLQDLVSETPKHFDSRLLCVRIAKVITSEPELCMHLQKYRTIPLKRLLTKIRVNQKTVERHRKYIIGICLVLLSNLDIMKNYVEMLIKGCDDDA